MTSIEVVRASITGITGHRVEMDNGFGITPLNLNLSYVTAALKP